MDKSRTPVIVSALRTPVGRGRKGSLANTRPDDLAALVLKETLSKTGVPATEVEDVIRRANDTEYGLVAYVFSEDMKRALQVCERLDYGMVGLNRGLVSDPAAPFGGTKQSGLGREGGHEGMLEFMETQYISAAW